MRNRIIAWASAVAIAAALVAGAWAASAGAQGKPPEPLGQVQRLEIRNALQRLELVETKMRLLEGEHAAARAALVALLKAASREGWDLDLGTLEYAKREPGKKEE